MTPRLSVLDLSAVPAAHPPSVAPRRTVQLAHAAEEAGFHRFWVGEHHNSRAVSSTAPQVMIAAIAATTTRIRVGSGGIMLPNHAPLAVAETFRVLAALHPGRIDLGLGRAPGTDPRTAGALRRGHAVQWPDFGDLYAELLGHAYGFPPGHPLAGVRAEPSDVDLPPVWILGTGRYGARAAGMNGAGFAFGGHIGDQDPRQAIDDYRRHFRPTAVGASTDRPSVILCIGAICAVTATRAEEMALAADLATARLRTGAAGPVPTPEEAAAHVWTPAELETAHRFRHTRVVGTPAVVRAELETRADKYGADEIMIITNVHDPGEQRLSYELIADAFHAG
ncbi:LLM class flavin-dependent oxidoreductase [Streptomyces sp. A012304]|uniref:LLM class flavin-dependent oxidoreductase n=1 Tax=Streptomyces sp. A012304 TaxID=375446 RepID=UPI00223293B1|nr:LLM class flavin-dependent oxidoreductase [Streptomyces sp. A012304]GKQ36406.1 N5,N10-methylene tetrahydromethanopterin reductase [Streptomyces sp. A012304]